MDIGLALDVRIMVEGDIGAVCPILWQVNKKQTGLTGGISTGGWAGGGWIYFGME